MIQQIQYCSGEGNRGRMEEKENEVCGGKDEGRARETGGGGDGQEEEGRITAIWTSSTTEWMWRTAL